MLSLEHPAIYLYKRNKNKIKIMVRNRFKDMIWKEWTLQDIDEMIRKDPHHFVTFNIMERQLLIKVLECDSITKTLLRRRGIIITKKTKKDDSGWEEVLKVINRFFEASLLKPRI